MSNLTLKSEQQIVGSMARTILAQTGLNDLNPGSILLTLLQAAAQEDFAQYYQMLQIVRNYNLDTTTGTDLDNRAFEYGLTRNQATAATGRITIQQAASFVEISSSFYTGFRSAIAGDTVIYINNGVGFPTSGAQQSLIVGSGTVNQEQVTYTPGVNNPQNFTNYYKITLDVPLTHDHAASELVILKQNADILIPAGTIVQVPAVGISQQVTFTTTADAVLLAGTSEVDNVDVQCTQVGTVGNIAVGAITGTSAFINPPFSGARATNDLAFSNGQDLETDTSLRNRIRSFIQGLAQSTTSGIQNAILGLTDPASAKSVVSANILQPNSVGLPVKIYIDDGTGFEPSYANQGEEVIIASALGGEQRLQTEFFPIVKAQVATLAFAPYDMSTNDLTLTINVGNQAETITFFTNDFAIPSAATALEVVNAINNVSTLVEARTADVGTALVITAKADTNEQITVTGGTANSILEFPTETVYTFYLYKNDQLLSKDGETALLDSGNIEPYNFSSTQTLLVVVDGKSANQQTITFHAADFPTPASATATQVAAVINAQLAGATASDANGKVRLVSNTGLSSLSSIQINSSTAATTLGFSLTPVTGVNSDYILNADLGVIQLNNPLVSGDKVTAGTALTRAFLTAANPGNYSFSGGETLVVTVDGGSPQTITFSAALNQSAAQVAATINTTLVGGTAVTRTVNSRSYLEIRTNSYDTGAGSISISSSSTSNTIFGFTTNTTVHSILPHTAYILSGTSGPYSFIEGDTLVVVMDQNTSGETFTITMSYPGTVTSGSSTTLFGASGLTSTFSIDEILENFWLVFKTGANTISGAVANVTNPTGTTFQYNFTSVPSGFQNFAVGDQASFSNMNSLNNDGNFLVTGITSINTVHSPVIDNTVSNPSALTPTTGDRHLIAVAANTVVNGVNIQSASVSNPSALTPSVGQAWIVAAAANSVTQPDVKGLYTDPSSPGVSEINGYRYIVNGSGVGAWTGHNNQIAYYNGIGTPGWLFITPSAGDVVYDEHSMHFYQFDGGSGTWIENDWGGKAGEVATWNGSIWVFTHSQDEEVRDVLDVASLYQYSLNTNTWTANVWGGKANEIAQWTGSSWTYEIPSTNDTVIITALSATYQYNGTSWIPFTFWVKVTNANGVIEASTASGSGLVGQRRQISDWNNVSGAITLANPVTHTPSPADTFVVIPGTKENVVSYFNNNQITSLASYAEVVLAENDSRIQIASLQNGSDGYVQVTGGKANNLLEFSNTLINGLQAYSYYTGLIKTVHSTIYGDETNLTTYPGVGAAGVKFEILPPLVLEAEFVINVGLAPGIALNNVTNQIQTAVIAYVNSLGIGKEIVLAAIIEDIMGIQGITDVQITTPSANVVVSDIELARTKASLITLNVLS
jgi:uncharacterized phage protein gp47/JayE